MYNAAYIMYNCNIGGYNERSDIFIVKTILERMRERLQDEGINEGEFSGSE